MIRPECGRATWRKSSHSLKNGNCVEVALLDASWRRSSHSLKNGECIEIADLGSQRAAIRDSKNPAGPTLALGHAELRAFVRAVGVATPSRSASA